LALRRKPESEQIKQQIGHMLGARRSTGRIRNVLYQKIAGKGQKAPAPSSQWENYPKNWLWKILAASRINLLNKWYASTKNNKSIGKVVK